MRTSLFGPLAVAVALTASAASAQAPAPPGGSAPTTLQRDPGSQTYTLSVNTREVIVELVATDPHGRAITDLKQDELQVFELQAHSQKVAERISGLRAVDPAAPKLAEQVSLSANWITLGRTCAMQTTPYYVLAYHPGPSAMASGYHEILITTTRDHTKLSFRHRYYVGATESLAKPEFRTAAEATAALERSTCYHPDMPPSLAISARRIDNGRPDSLQYVILLRSDSLAFTSLAEGASRAQFDYGICTLDAAGMPIRFMQMAADRVLGPEEYADVLAGGFGNLVGFPRGGNPAFARFIVRDRRTGNIGVTNAVIPTVAGQLSQPGRIATGGIAAQGGKATPDIPVSSFGVPVPRPGAFCGDVYELPQIVGGLPDFWKLEPVGTVYAYALNVPGQLILDTIGIPGVTSRNAWFAIDYYAEFWVTHPGDYRFELTSDDGSKLYVDDQMIINVDGVHPEAGGGGHINLSAGRHTLHVPYFQGPPRSVALMLWVKVPEGKLKPFDLREFTPPGQ